MGEASVAQDMRRTKRTPKKMPMRSATGAGMRRMVGMQGILNGAIFQIQSSLTIKNYSVGVFRFLVRVLDIGR